MKKLLFAIPILGILMSSCSSEEPAGMNGNTTNGVVNNYLTVNVIPTTGGGTRAEGATGEGDHLEGGEGGDYVNGSDSEKQVNEIRFFFFDESGAGAPVSIVTKDGEDSNVSYIDWVHYDSDLGAGDSDITVEATLQATLGLFIPDNTHVPASLIAVINPSETVKELTGNGNSPYGPTMSQVQNAVADYQSGLTNGNFVMSNSVYANTLGTPLSAVNYTSLTPADGKPSYFQSSIEAAQANPVTIYVERVVARLDLYIGLDTEKAIELDNGTFLYPVMKQVKNPDGSILENADPVQATVNITDEDGKSVATKVYVKFLGWNITSTPNQSYLVKNINPEWTSKTLFGDESNLLWNSMDYHRSFWAINPNKVDYLYGNFGDESGKDVTGNFQPAQANKMPAAGKFATTYMQENAAESSESLAPVYPTQVILAAQLVDKNGNAIELAEWGYNKYSQADLLTYLATNVISKGNFWKKTGENKYEKLTYTDLQFVSSKSYPGGTPANSKDYYSYVVVKTTEPTTEWYQWTGEGEAPTENDVTQDEENFTKTTTEDINKFILDNVGYTMSWYNGYTYYYFDVRHLGQPNSPAFYGIVRNHLYEATVKTLFGYGTPVPNPDEIIIPQTPEYEEVLLAAEIKILEWRVVKADYDLNW